MCSTSVTSQHAATHQDAATRVMRQQQQCSSNCTRTCPCHWPEAETNTPSGGACINHYMAPDLAQMAMKHSILCHAICMPPGLRVFPAEALRCRLHCFCNTAAAVTDGDRMLLKATTATAAVLLLLRCILWLPCLQMCWAHTCGIWCFLALLQCCRLGRVCSHPQQKVCHPD